MSKDLNGGFGTADTCQDTVYARILTSLKKICINLPVLSLAFLMGIFKQRNLPVQFYEGTLPEQEPDIILIYGSIVDYKNENAVCRELKGKFKNARIGFIGAFPSVKPELFDSGDFVIVGDFVYFFLKDFTNKSQLQGNVVVKGRVNLDELPSPEPEGFPVKRYSYFPAITHKPFFTLQASTGCPFSCAYYCAYAAAQGQELSVRSPKNVVKDMLYLHQTYGIRGFQFRDPTFGLKKGFIEELCAEIKNAKLKVRWGIETRLDVLDEQKITLMREVGLRNINVGIETSNPVIAAQNKRTLTSQDSQEKLIRYCEKIGVKISAFYLFGYRGDTKEFIESVIRYAKKLNTFLARFAVLTPFPGTEFFDEVEKQGKITSHDYEHYTQFTLVMKHDTLSQATMQALLSKAYREYYFRCGYVAKLLLWKIREVWL